MSYEIQSLRLCDHKIYNQRLVPQDDLQTLVMPFPLGNDKVKITFNHKPLTDNSVYNWDLAKRVTRFTDENASATFDGLFVYAKYPPIKRAFGTDALKVQVNGTTVVATDVDYGRGVVALPNPLSITNSDVITLDYVQDLGADILYKDILFEEPFRSTRHIFQVTYTTLRQYCLKCLGRGYVADWDLTQSGDVSIVFNEEKLIQDMRRYILTILGSDPYRQWLGTRLRGLIGKKIVSNQFVQDLIQSEVVETLHKLIQLQSEQLKWSPMSDREILRNVVSVQTTLDANDPTLWNVRVTGETLAGTTVEVISQFDSVFKDFAIGS